jgi:hypothetical protein
VTRGAWTSSCSISSPLRCLRWTVRSAACRSCACSCCLPRSSSVACVSRTPSSSVRVSARSAAMRTCWPGVSLSRPETTRRHAAGTPVRLLPRENPPDVLWRDPHRSDPGWPLRRMGARSARLHRPGRHSRGDRAGDAGSYRLSPRRPARGRLAGPHTSDGARHRSLKALSGRRREDQGSAFPCWPPLHRPAGWPVSPRRGRTRSCPAR